MKRFSLQANIVDIRRRSIFSGEVTVDDGKIISVLPVATAADAALPFILPGFVDSHVHIESSMLVPSEFARLAVVHGTVATVSDPHEIANVCGMEGVQFMIDNGNTVNFKFYFGAPSCVPATIFETAGAALDAGNVAELLQKNEVRYLSEMMNFPGVINDDAEVMSKINSAHCLNKPVDGHAPGLRGEALKKYVAAGISTDHECFTKEEALEKLSLGMKILIREGSAAKNFEALADLLNEYAGEMMFCSDDKHPDNLVKGHINELCARAVKKGIDVFNVLQAACINPVEHYGLANGTLRETDPADFIILQDLIEFKVLKTFINGECVAADGQTLLASAPVSLINRFEAAPIQSADLAAAASAYLIGGMLPVIGAIDGQLITKKLMVAPKTSDDSIMSDTSADILKLVVVNRYSKSAPAISFIGNFGLTRGAIASSVAHDSHNIIAVGVDDESIARAVNLVIQKKGGISAVDGTLEKVLALPVAGLMSDIDGYAVADAYSDLHATAVAMGSTLSAPYMTLSFMALLVIPSLKLSDRGLFDGDRFQFAY